MNFNKGKIKASLLTTDVENLFINDYMIDAPGDYVKVYLYGLMCSQHQTEVSNKAFAAQLGLSQAEVEEAWKYWEERGLVKKHLESVELLSIREMLVSGTADASFGMEKTVSKKAENDDENSLKKLFISVENHMGRPLTGREMQDISYWVEKDGIKAELVNEAFSYASMRGKANINYVSKIIIEWHSKGLETAEDVRESIEAFELKQGLYKKVINSLGLSRNATPSEKKMIDSWLEKGLDETTIMDACAKAGFNQSPNLRYINKILENWEAEAKKECRDVNQKLNVSKEVLDGYYEQLRNEAYEKSENRKREIYSLLPQIEEIDEKLKSLGMELSRGLLRGMGKSELDEKRNIIAGLEDERAKILVSHEYPADYTDLKYACEKCSDTGIDENGARCSCQSVRRGEAEVWQRTRK